MVSNMLREITIYLEEDEADVLEKSSTNAGFDEYGYKLSLQNIVYGIVRDHIYEKGKK